MLLPILCFLSFLTFPTTPSAGEADTMEIFSAARTYHYKATFVSPAGETLSTERITFKPSGQPWKYQKSQTAFEIIYNYTPQDSVTFLSYPNPKSTEGKKQVPYIWHKSEITGAVEHDEKVWIHPIRGNQYVYT